jgi:neurofibromin 1
LRRRDSYADEQYTLLKPLENANSSELLCTILLFLDASSLTLFNGAPNFGPEWLVFFEETFATFSTYLATDDERIRSLANTVARKIMSEGTVSFWRKTRSVGSKPFKYNFWKTT